MAHVALINTANVDQRAIADVAVAANMPSGHIRLIVGDPLLPDLYQGVTIARAHVRYAQNVFGLEQHLGEQWDCGVVIGEKWAKLQPQYPAYFAYLLGHEFGHATTVLTDLGLTVYEDLILQSRGLIDSERKWRWDDLPYEVLYDRFGVAIAEEIFGRDAVERELRTIIDRGITSDVPRIEKALTTAPTKDLTSLHSELAVFSAPYKDQLLAMWQGERDKGRLGIADGLRSLDCLWTAGPELPSSEP